MPLDPEVEEFAHDLAVEVNDLLKYMKQRNLVPTKAIVIFAAASGFLLDHLRVSKTDRFELQKQILKFFVTSKESQQ